MCWRVWGVGNFLPSWILDPHSQSGSGSEYSRPKSKQIPVRITDGGEVILKMTQMSTTRPIYSEIKNKFQSIAAYSISKCFLTLKTQIFCTVIYELHIFFAS